MAKAADKRIFNRFAPLLVLLSLLLLATQGCSIALQETPPPTPTPAPAPGSAQAIQAELKHNAETMTAAQIEEYARGLASKKVSESHAWVVEVAREESSSGPIYAVAVSLDKDIATHEATLQMLSGAMRNFDIEKLSKGQELTFTGRISYVATPEFLKSFAGAKLVPYELVIIADATTVAASSP